MMTRSISSLMTISLLSIVLVLLSACQGGGKSEEGVTSPYFGGTEGVLATFQTDVTEVYEDETFPIDVMLENKGEHTVLANEIQLEIKGISSADFSGITFTMTNDDELEKVSKFLPEGDYEVIHFGDLKYEGLSGTFYDANILLEYTYPYQTNIAIPRVCFKKDLRDARYCDIQGSKSAFASAGPIQIGSVTESAAGSGKIYLEIPVYNAGVGRAKAYLNDGFSNLYDQVAFEVNTDGFSCTAKGDPTIARMSRSGEDKTIIIRCVSDELEEGALFTKQIDLTISYYYQDYIAQVVRINENPELWD